MIATSPSDRERADLLHELEEMAGDDRLSSEQLEELAERYRVPRSLVHGLSTFYFPGPAGSGSEVCSGLPCMLRRWSAGGGEPPAGSRQVSCLGYCRHAPVVRREGHVFQDTPEGPREIPESTPEFVQAHRQDLPVYRARGGYATLARYLAAPDPEGLLRTVEAAGLRGLGGAGYPVHLKWKAVRARQDPHRLLLVNAHEGEPATFKDREILENEPHRVLEGALLAALAVGAERILIGLRSDYENARSSLETALGELEGLRRLLWPGAALPRIELRSVPGPYVTGEETALLEALEGRRSEPRLRPPFPAEAGLHGHPTLVQNVETLASLTRLLARVEHARNGSRPEKVYCLTGDVARPGAYRHPIGVTAEELVERDGGSPGSELKAFLPGGLSGGLLPSSSLSLPLEFDAVRREGASLGTGAVVAIGRSRCLVEVLENIASFFANESCGKCAPCRLGTTKLQRLMAALRDGQASELDLEEGLALAAALRETSICALGQVAGKAFEDAMKHFPGELLAHTRGECPARRPVAEVGR